MARGIIHETRGEQICKAFVKPFLCKFSHSIQCDSLHKNGFMNGLHTNLFCSCFLNEAQSVYVCG